MDQAQSSPSKNRYSVRPALKAGGWRVEIFDPEKKVVSQRVCRDGAEARAYSSTVRQHIHWLSEGKFIEYYQLGE